MKINILTIIIQDKSLSNDPDGIFKLVSSHIFTCKRRHA